MLTEHATVLELGIRGVRDFACVTAPPIAFLVLPPTTLSLYFAQTKL